VIPTIISQLAAGRTTIDLGNVRPTRDFSYVEDTCLGLVAVAEAAEGAGHAFNIGTGYDISIKDLFEKIKNVMGVEADYEVDKQRIRPDLSEVQRLQCDSSKLHRHTGFKNEVSLEDGLQITVDWFSKPGNLNKYKTHLYAI
jgi:nucleoside-diphosphate-sugar epimerase